MLPLIVVPLNLSPKLLRKVAFCRLLLLCVSRPVVLRPILWHGILSGKTQQAPNMTFVK